MIKVTRIEDLEQVDEEIVPHIRNLLDYFLEEYCDFCSDSIEAIGAIFLLEDNLDWQKYLEMGLSEPIKSESFEWILPLGNTEYKIGCINIETDKSIDIVAKSSLFATFCA